MAQCGSHAARFVRCAAGVGVGVKQKGCHWQVVSAPMALTNLLCNISVVTWRFVGSIHMC
jgi:hypothetical protein